MIMEGVMMVAHSHQKYNDYNRNKDERERLRSHSRQFPSSFL